MTGEAGGAGVWAARVRHPLRVPTRARAHPSPTAPP